MAQTCYRHPSRETGVSCSSCGRPICPECMTPSPVGMRCPECATHRTRVTRGVPGPADGALARYPATAVLIAVNVIVFLAEIAGAHGGFNAEASPLIPKYALFGPAVAGGEWYRLLTSAFLHASLFHIGGNMVLLYFLGRIIEPAIGTARFLAIYFVALFAGSLGALIFTPDGLSLGASGAVFGVLGAGFVIARGRGIEGLAASIGFLIVLNLAFSLGVPGISIGAHVGGLVAGVACGGLVLAGERGMLGARHTAAELTAMTALGVLAIVVAIAIA